MPHFGILARKGNSDGPIYLQLNTPDSQNLETMSDPSLVNNSTRLETRTTRFGRGASDRIATSEPNSIPLLSTLEVEKEFSSHSLVPICHNTLRHNFIFVFIIIIIVVVVVVIITTTTIIIII
jgi:hypothetical protein